MTPVKDYFISHKKPIALVLFIIIIAGLYSYTKIQTSLFPDITFPKIKIIADEGLQPVNKMMVTVTKPLENAIKQVKLVNTSLKESLKSTITSTVGALLSQKAFKAFKKRLDYREYGGAPLLGVRGVCIVGHGSSNDRAIMNGIRVAAEFASNEVNPAIERMLAQKLEPTAG